MHKIAVFASGAGTNAQNMIRYFERHNTISVALVVCNKPGAGVLDIARNERIPFLILDKEKFFSGDAYVPELAQAGIELIALAGFLWKIPDALIRSFPGRIVNIHPALLPLYGGKGMYGRAVHQAVLDAGDPQSGITIHYVDEQYDHGKTIFQARCRVDMDDTPETLAKKIHRLEYEHYPVVVEQLLNSKPYKT